MYFVRGSLVNFGSSSEAIDRRTVSVGQIHVSFFTNVAKSAAAFDAS